ncbi:MULTISPECIES: ATP-binding protein [unclassified Nitrobacter]|uniref:ATP-binding protein n=1 Tax=unclassified Nitrobacter TaxID=2620411 RepID=UPI0003239FFB|nr:MULTISPECIES: ATP-binding protein [unclassified Nitrobacter]MCV0387311.1 response regulator [Nitrobacter sp.]
MAPTSRGLGRPQTPKRQAVKKRVLKKSPKAAKTRRSSSQSTSGVVEAALAAFAHEVRTPLTGILAVSDLLATSDLGERERRWVETIKAGADHLASLATLFVDAARSRRSAPGGRQDFFDLRALARNAGDSLAGRATAKGLRSAVEISDRLPVFVTGDSVRLRAALENLIDNAVKFTEQGDVVLRVTAPRRSGKKISVTFVVSDSGIGLSLAEIRRLFRPYSQANVSIASRFGGAGLGLSSVKQLARAMGGDVMATQRRGGGTTFTFTVLLTPAEGPVSIPSGNDLGSPSNVSNGLRILSVEDNPFGRVVLNTILTELGHQAEFVGRGEDAVHRIAQGGFDAVLMDMVLPGITGVEAIGRIRALDAPVGRVAIIGMSGRSEDEAASRAAGGDVFLLKPVSPRALATALLEAKHRAATST